MAELLRLECGCTAEVDHDRGDRLVRCPGRRDGETVLCPGGLTYCVTAEPVTSVLYTSSRTTVPEVHQ